MSEANIGELILRGEDFEVFAEEILGVKLNRAQKRIARIMRHHGTRQWMFKELVVVAANQIGKTLMEACIMLWACTYKIGVPTEDMKVWEAEPYLWIHLGPVQQQSYHAHKDAKLLVKGEHPAQGGRCKLPAGMIYEIKIEGYYDGFACVNGSQIMFRTSEHKAEAVLGYRASAISVDEAAFVDYLSEVKNTVLMMRLIASGGPLLMFSTPNGMNDFFEEADSIKSSGDEIEDMVWQDDSRFLVWAVITDNLGYGLDQDEIDRMERSLNPATKEQQLRGAFLEPLEAFFVPQSRILDSFKDDMPESQQPVPGHKYAIFWDPSVSSDPVACIVLDVTEWPWQGVHFGHWEKPMDVMGLIGEMFRVHRAYHGFKDKNVLSVPSRAVTGFDATSMGGAVMKSLMVDINPKRPVNFGGTSTKKIAALTNLRDRLTKAEIVFPTAWKRLRQELLNYKLKDTDLKQDSVMALMGADIVATSMTGGRSQKGIDPHARITRTNRRRRIPVWR